MRPPLNRAARPSPCAACATPITATPCSTAWTWTCRPARCWPCWARRAAARARCSGPGRAAAPAVRQHPHRRPDRVRRPPPRSTEARGLGMVFQDYALWPHMSVAQNVGFPLEMRGVPRRERPGRVAEALALVGLEALAGRRRPSCPAASNSASRWPAPSSAARACCCSMSRCPTWTATCARRSAPRSARCCAAWAPPPSM